MKTLLLLLFPILCFAQVGINTTTPTAMLDIDGDLRVRQIPNASNTEFLTIDAIGNVGKQTVVPPSSIPPLHYVQETANRYEQGFSDVFSQSGNITLGFETTVSVPAGQSAWINIYYKIPIYVKTHSDTQMLLYVGVNPRMNGIRLRYSDTKKEMALTTQLPSTGEAIFRMFQASSTIKEFVSNTGGTSPLNVVFSFHGYVEAHGGIYSYNSTYTPSQPYRVAWGAYSNTNSSYNEGIGYIAVRVDYY